MKIINRVLTYLGLAKKTDTAQASATGCYEIMESSHYVSKVLARDLNKMLGGNKYLVLQYIQDNYEVSVTPMPSGILEIAVTKSLDTYTPCNVIVTLLQDGAVFTSFCVECNPAPRSHP